MEIQKPRYRFSPSLLNSFQELIDSDSLYEQFYGNSEDPEITPEEYYAQKEKELLDACNRVPFTSEACSRGVALNEIVDCIIEKRKQKEGMTVERIYDENGSVIALHSELDGFSFDFDISLVNELAKRFSGAVCQYRCEATIDTEYGPVILYGDLDYLIRDIVYDLKTTTNYSAYGKFSSGLQKDLYPYCLIESKDMASVSGFEYTIVTIKKPTKERRFIEGELHTEWFAYNHRTSTNTLKSICESFIEWIEQHRDLITHKRIFNQI